MPSQFPLRGWIRGETIEENKSGRGESFNREILSRAPCKVRDRFDHGNDAEGFDKSRDYSKAEETPSTLSWPDEWFRLEYEKMQQRSKFHRAIAHRLTCSSDALLLCYAPDAARLSHHGTMIQ